MELNLSKKQLDRIQYECNLLKLSPQQLYIIAPHLFHEGVTSANTEIKNDTFNELKEQAKEYLKSLESDDTYHSFY